MLSNRRHTEISGSIRQRSVLSNGWVRGAYNINGVGGRTRESATPTVSGITEVVRVFIDSVVSTQNTITLVLSDVLVYGQSLSGADNNEYKLRATSLTHADLGESEDVHEVDFNFINVDPTRTTVTISGLRYPGTVYQIDIYAKLTRPTGFEDGFDIVFSDWEYNIVRYSTYAADTLSAVMVTDDRTSWQLSMELTDVQINGLSTALDSFDTYVVRATPRNVEISENVIILTVNAYTSPIFLLEDLLPNTDYQIDIQLSRTGSTFANGGWVNNVAVTQNTSTLPILSSYNVVMNMETTITDYLPEADGSVTNSTTPRISIQFTSLTDGLSSSAGGGIEYIEIEGRPVYLQPNPIYDPTGVSAERIIKRFDTNLVPDRTYEIYYAAIKPSLAYDYYVNIKRRNHPAIPSNTLSPVNAPSIKFKNSIKANSTNSYHHIKDGEMTATTTFTDIRNLMQGDATYRVVGKWFDPAGGPANDGPWGTPTFYTTTAGDGLNTFTHVDTISDVPDGTTYYYYYELHVRTFDGAYLINLANTFDERHLHEHTAGYTTQIVTSGLNNSVDWGNAFATPVWIVQVIGQALVQFTVYPVCDLTTRIQIPQQTDIVESHVIITDTIVGTVANPAMPVQTHIQQISANLFNGLTTRTKDTTAYTFEIQLYAGRTFTIKTALYYRMQNGSLQTIQPITDSVHIASTNLLMGQFSPSNALLRQYFTMVSEEQAGTLSYEVPAGQSDILRLQYNSVSESPEGSNYAETVFNSFDGVESLPDTIKTNIIQRPDPQTWPRMVPTLNTNFDVVLDFRITSQVPVVANYNVPLFSIGTESTAGLPLGGWNIGIYHQGIEEQYKIQTRFNAMLYDSHPIDAGVGTTGVKPMITHAQTFDQNTIFNTGDTLWHATEPTRYRMEWKYRYFEEDTPGSSGELNAASVVRLYVNGQYIPPNAGTPISRSLGYLKEHFQRPMIIDPSSNLQAAYHWGGVHIYEMSVNRATPELTFDHINSIPTFEIVSGSVTATGYVLKLTGNILCDGPLWGTSDPLNTSYNAWVEDLENDVGAPFNLAVVLFQSNPTSFTPNEVNSGTANVTIQVTGKTMSATDFRYRNFRLLFRPASWAPSGYNPTSTAYAGEFAIRHYFPKPPAPPEPVFSAVRPYPNFYMDGNVAVYQTQNPSPAYPYANDATKNYNTWISSDAGWGSGTYITQSISNNVSYIYPLLNQYQQLGQNGYPLLAFEGARFSYHPAIGGNGETTNSTIDYIMTLPLAIKMDHVTWVSRYDNIIEGNIDYPDRGWVYGVKPDDTQILIGSMQIPSFSFATRYDDGYYYKSAYLGNRDAINIACTSTELFTRFRIKWHSYFGNVSRRLDTKYIMVYGSEEL